MRSGHSRTTGGNESFQRQHLERHERLKLEQTAAATKTFRQHNFLSCVEHDQVYKNPRRVHAPLCAFSRAHPLLRIGEQHMHCINEKPLTKRLNVADNPIRRIGQQCRGGLWSRPHPRAFEEPRKHTMRPKAVEFEPAQERSSTAKES